MQYKLFLKGMTVGVTLGLTKDKNGNNFENQKALFPHKPVFKKT